MSVSTRSIGIHTANGPTHVVCRRLDYVSHLDLQSRLVCSFLVLFDAADGRSFHNSRTSDLYQARRPFKSNISPSFDIISVDEAQHRQIGARLLVQSERWPLSERLSSCLMVGKIRRQTGIAPATGSPSKSATFPSTVKASISSLALEARTTLDEGSHHGTQPRLWSRYCHLAGRLSCFRGARRGINSGLVGLGAFPSSIASLSFQHRHHGTRTHRQDQ